MFSSTPGGFDNGVRGPLLLRTPSLNRGTAFTLEERATLGLTGLLPSAVTTLDQQAKLAYAQYEQQPDDLAKNLYLTALHDRNEVLFYRLLSDHLREMLPIVYTPTVALAIERYSREYRRPRGVFLSIDQPELIEESLRNCGAGPDNIDLIVVTDGERVLGIGDWGVGGIDIAIGKLAVYTAAGGIDPTRAMPVILDVGTNRESLLQDPQYLGQRHSRVSGIPYDAFIERFVRTATRLFPNALLHWEDLGVGNARRIVERYRDQVCTFNDDMQGTGAVVVAASLAAARAAGLRLREQRVVVFGAGTAGIGIADQLRDAMIREGLSRDEATRRFWCLTRLGLLTQDMGAALRDFQVPYARPVDEIRGWERQLAAGGVGLAEVVRQVHPTMLVGASTMANAFTEPIIREMAAHSERPIIFPLTNPTSLSEAVPVDLIAWTEGRALIATGSPFNAVTYGGITYTIAQANNALVFPGLGLGAIVARARKVSDGMLAAAAEAVAGLIDATQSGPSLLPPVENMRAVSASVAAAVAQAAVAEGLAPTPLTDVNRQVREAMWEPVYKPLTELVSRAERHA